LGGYYVEGEVASVFEVLERCMWMEGWDEREWERWWYEWKLGLVSCSVASIPSEAFGI